MRLRHACLVMLAVVLLAPPGAHADNHWGDIRAGASYSAGSSLGGFQLTGTKTLGKYAPLLSDIVVDANVQWGKDLTQWSFFGGFRRTLVSAKCQPTEPFIQVLIGGAQDHQTPKRRNWDAMLVTGVGIEFLNDHKQKDGTCKERRFALRGQFDWISSLSGDIDPYARFSFGVVVRFDRKGHPLAP